MMELHATRPVSERRAWLALAVMVATMLYAVVDRQVFSLVAADMSKSLSLSNTELGLIQGLGLAIFTFLGAYPIAWLADRFDRRWVLSICLVFWALGTAACGLVGGFSTLFAASAAVAASEAGIAPIFMSMLAELFRGQARVTATMVYYVAVSLSMAAGLFLVGTMIAAIDMLKPMPAPFAQMEDWRLAFLAAAAPFPIFALLLFALPEGRASRIGQPGAAAAAPMWPFLSANLRSVLMTFIGMTFFALGLTGMLAWTPVSLTRIFGTPPAEVGMVFGAVLAVASIVGVVVGNFVLRWQQRKIGFRAAPRVVWVSLLLALPLLCMVPLATAEWQVYLGVGMQVVVSTLAGAASVTMLQDLAPANVRARVMAIRAMTYGPAIGIGVAGSAFLADIISSGPRSLFWGGLAVILPSWIICIILLRLAERPFDETARQSTGLSHPLAGEIGQVAQ